MTLLTILLLLVIGQIIFAAGGVAPLREQLRVFLFIGVAWLVIATLVSFDVFTRLWVYDNLGKVELYMNNGHFNSPEWERYITGEYIFWYISQCFMIVVPIIVIAELFLARRKVLGLLERLGYIAALILSCVLLVWMIAMVFFETVQEGTFTIFAGISSALTGKPVFDPIAEGRIAFVKTVGFTVALSLCGWYIIRKSRTTKDDPFGLGEP